MTPKLVSVEEIAALRQRCVVLGAYHPLHSTISIDTSLLLRLLDALAAPPLLALPSGLPGWTGACDTVQDLVAQAERFKARADALQRERDDLVRRLTKWAESNAYEHAVGKTPTWVNPYTVASWMGVELVTFPQSPKE